MCALDGHDVFCQTLKKIYNIIFAFASARFFSKVVPKCNLYNAYTYTCTIVDLY